MISTRNRSRFLWIVLAAGVAAQATGQPVGDLSTLEE